MGTNFYADEVAHGQTVTHHIGKRSFGWPFLFNNAKTPDEWRSFLLAPMTSDVYDEYGSSIRPSDFWRMVDNRPAKDLPPKAERRYYSRDHKGYWSVRFDGEWS